MHALNINACSIDVQSTSMHAALMCRAHQCMPTETAGILAERLNARVATLYYSVDWNYISHFYYFITINSRNSRIGDVPKKLFGIRGNVCEFFSFPHFPFQSWNIKNCPGESSYHIITILWFSLRFILAPQPSPGDLVEVEAADPPPKKTGSKQQQQQA